MNEAFATNASRPRLSIERFFYGWLYVTAALTCLVFAGWYLDNEILLGISLGFAVVAALFAFVTYFGVAPARRDIQQMVGGDFYAHWVYSREEWDLHIEREHRRKPVHTLQYFLIGLAFGAATALMVAGATVWLEHEPLANAWPGAGFLMGGIAALFTLVGAFMDFFRYLRLVDLKRSGGEVYIGRLGLYYCGDFWASTRGHLFRGIRFDASPPGLSFDFEIRVRNGSYIETVVVPLPPGRESLAPKIVELIKAQW